MRKRTQLFCVAAAALIGISAAVTAQTPAAPSFAAIPGIKFDQSNPVIHARSEALKPVTVSGEHGVLLGQQDGSFEAWVLPVKLLSHLTIEANIEGYTVPIDVNAQSSEVEVRPDRTVITYAHIGFTVRQIMFSPNNGPAGTGPVVLFEFDCLKPTDFTLRFTPNLEFMWPARNEGHPNPEWVAQGGFYVLHADYPDLAAAITIPGARPGILAPYQERPQSHPVELKLHIDPARDKGKLFPLLMAVGTDPAAATNAALGATLDKLNQDIVAAYATHDESYKQLLADSVSIATPDKSLNEAFQWSVVSIEQLKAKPWAPKDSAVANANETALVAGYYASGDSARPGFGWFFGRDALYTLYAVNGYGDFALTRSELEFLMHRQRADGKIMHEYSQTAAAIDWQAFSYMYAAADATPLFLLAMQDYVHASGDVAFLTAHRDAVEKAWEFETSHAPDASHGGNGIYTNEQGTGWVESWPGGMPHQEVYLALLDQQASVAMAQIATLLHNEKTAQAAQARAEAIAKTINAQFHDAEKGCYAFSRNANGSLDRTTTVYPALAWWSGNSILEHSGECLTQLAAHTLDTDWGLRDVSNQEKIYDGMSYHQGSVWPLFTGWAALAEYRGGQPLAGYKMLKENANLTWAQDLGAVTELLSGDYFVPFGRSTSHQLWSSSFVITPTLRGLFGIDIDATTKTITVNPHLPASWDHAEVLNLPIAGGKVSLYFEKRNGQLEVYMSPTAGEDWHLRSGAAGATFGPIDEAIAKKLHVARQNGLRIPLPALQVDAVDSTVDVADSAKAYLPNQLPLPGAGTGQFRIVHEELKDHALTLTVEGLGGTDGILRLIRNGHFVPKVQPQAGENNGEASISFRGCDADPYACASLPLTFHFPAGEGWKTVNVTLTW